MNSGQKQTKWKKLVQRAEDNRLFVILAGILAVLVAAETFAGVFGSSVTDMFFLIGSRLSESTCIWLAGENSERFNLCLEIW